MYNKYQDDLEYFILNKPESIKKLSKQGSKLALSLPENDFYVLHFAELIKDVLGLKYTEVQYARKIIATFEYMTEHFHSVTQNSMFEDWCNSLKIYPSSYK